MTPDDVAITPLTRAILARSVSDFIAIAADVPGEYWTEHHFLLELPMKWRLSLAAWANGKPVGYAIVSQKASTVAHLHHFVLSPAWRRRGLGARLLTAATSRAVGQNLVNFTLKVAETNAAQQFYERHGFVKSGVCNGHYAYTRLLSAA